MKWIALGFLALPFLSGCAPSSANLEEAKAAAPAVFRQAGYEIAGYEGYQWGATMLLPSYGGARVWFMLRRIPDNGITYNAYIQRWGDEWHIYEIKAIDAIKPR